MQIQIMQWNFYIALLKGLVISRENQEKKHT